MHEPECPYEIGGDECHCFSIQTAIDNERERIARVWQTRDWPLLTEHVKAGSVIGAAQAVTDWLRSGADR